MAPAPAAGATLSRELSDLLLRLAIGLHKHAIYPQGHPMRGEAVDAVAERLHTVHAARPLLSLGVARRQLVIDGVATDPENPVLRELARRLHQHQVGALTLVAGIGAEEIAAVLALLATDPERGGDGMPPGPAGANGAWRERWPHVRLHPLTFGQLELQERSDGVEEETGDAAARAASLWIGLARAALAAEPGNDAPDPGDAPPAVVAQAIDAHGHEVAYDQVIVGYMLQISAELRTGGPEAETLRRRVSQMVGAMRPETLQRLMHMGGDPTQRGQFVLDSSHALAADAVVQVVEAAGAASGQTVSHAFLRLLTKMAAHAEHGSGEIRPRASTALREQVQRLVRGWELTDPNPETYRAKLDAMARTVDIAILPDGDGGVEPSRLVAMALETELAAPAVWRAIDAMLERGESAALIGLLDAAGDAPLAPALASHAATASRLRDVLARDPLDLPLLEWMVARLGALAVPPLLDALAAAERRATRWKLLTLLESLGPAVAPLAVERLAGAPWYVQRNLLQLLGKLQAPVEGLSAQPYLRHADARVRREAVKTMLRMPGGRSAAIRAALADADHGVVQIGLGAAVEECPPALVPQVARLAALEGAEPHLRALALRVLGGSEDPLARDALLHAAAPRRTLLGRPRLAPRGPELLAALNALASRWRGDRRAAELLALAAASEHADVRAVVQQEAVAAL